MFSLNLAGELRRGHDLAATGAFGKRSAIRIGGGRTPHAKAARNPNAVMMMTAVVALPNELIFVSGGLLRPHASEVGSVVRAPRSCVSRHRREWAEGA
jgi:hypothetical protein